MKKLQGIDLMHCFLIFFFSQIPPIAKGSIPVSLKDGLQVQFEVTCGMNKGSLKSNVIS